MPKKFKGENTKAVVARNRKAEKLATEKEIKAKAAEDALWKEDDKLICKKIQRKEEKERKKIEDAQKKKEKKLLEEQEIEELTPKAPPKKVTAFQLQKQKEETKKLESEKEKEEVVTHLDMPLTENLNRMEPETVSASGIDAAVAALSVNGTEEVDRHPEKRMAAAFRAFEASRLPQLKKDNPNFRHSQLKQLLRKEWQKSPQNPLNQRVKS